MLNSEKEEFEKFQKEEQERIEKFDTEAKKIIRRMENSLDAMRNKSHLTEVKKFKEKYNAIVKQIEGQHFDSHTGAGVVRVKVDVITEDAFPNLKNDLYELETLERSAKMAVIGEINEKNKEELGKAFEELKNAKEEVKKQIKEIRDSRILETHASLFEVKKLTKNIEEFEKAEKTLDSIQTMERFKQDISTNQEMAQKGISIFLQNEENKLKKDFKEEIEKIEKAGVFKKYGSLEGVENLLKENEKIDIKGGVTKEGIKKAEKNLETILKNVIEKEKSRGLFGRKFAFLSSPSELTKTAQEVLKNIESHKSSEKINSENENKLRK